MLTFSMDALDLSTAIALPYHTWPWGTNPSLYVDPMPHCTCIKSNNRCGNGHHEVVSAFVKGSS